jgi:hypothetical protein
MFHCFGHVARGLLPQVKFCDYILISYRIITIAAAALLDEITS